MPRIQLHTSAAHTADGELLAKRVKARAEATELLLKRPPIGLAWTLAVQGTVGAVLGWLLTRDAAAPLAMLGPMAGAGVMLAVAASVQCVRLHRRQQAVIALLLAEPPPR